MEKKYVLISVHDEKSKKIAEVLGNKTSKKIIDFLTSTKEANENDIASSLDSPINTIEYNIKKLVDSGLVEKSRNYFWSKKGKKIPTYKLSNKSIIISPKHTSTISSKLKSILPVVGITALVGIFIKVYSENREAETIETAALRSADAVESSGAFNSSLFSLSSAQPEVWFLIGAFITMLLLVVINWRKL